MSGRTPREALIDAAIKRAAPTLTLENCRAVLWFGEVSLSGYQKICRAFRELSATEMPTLTP